MDLTADFQRYAAVQIVDRKLRTRHHLPDDRHTYALLARYLQEHRVFEKAPEDLLALKTFWHHGIACGLASKAIAKLKNEKNLDIYYVGGMIHDIGSLVIYNQIPEKGKLALVQYNEWGPSLIDAEQDVMGFNHAQVWTALMKKGSL